MLNQLENHSSHIAFYDLASLATLFSGLTLALLLGFTKKNGHTTNLFLNFALTVSVLKTGGMVSFFSPALGPLLYFYVRQRITPDRHFSWKDMLHFWLLPAGAWMPAWLIPGSVLIYLYMSYQLIQAFYGQLQPVLMDRPRFAFRRVKKALVWLGFFCILWLFNDLFAFAIAFVLMGMVVHVLLKPEGSTQLSVPVVDRSDAREKGRWLKEVVTVNRLYADPELTLTSLAVRLGIHPHDLSKSINLGLEQNFNDFINGFRVREIVRKMRDPANDRLTLVGIAYESGFNSERTFHRAFKELTGKTPLEYKNSLKKELPIDKLATPSPMPPVILPSESPIAWAKEKSNRNYMFRNYFKTAFRYLLQNKVYSFINIAGLSFGLACAMLILLYVQDEVSYDRFHGNVSRIYRIDKQTSKGDGSVSNGSYTGYFPGPRFAANIPEIQSFVRFQPAQADIKTGTDIQSQAIRLVDTNFFSVFNFPLLSGNARTALTEPNSIVISEGMAKRYFGTADAVGKTIAIRQDSIFTPHVVTGVAQNCPQNSSIKFEVLLPLNISATDESNNGNWFNSFLSTFVVLSPGADIKAVQNKMDRVFESDAGRAISEIKNKYGVKNIGIAYLLEPLADIHLGRLVPDENEILSDKSNPEFSYILSAIAIFVLLIACINFVNLTVARSVKRAKEIGIRKVIGGTSGQLRIQFLSESLILCLMAFMLALAIVVTILPVFNQLANKALSLTYLLNFRMIISYITLFLSTGLLAGFYPSMVLSGYDPVATLYSRFNLAGKNYLQKILVVFQFALASFLIIGAITIYLQFSYLTTQNLGYDDTNLITVNKYPLSRSEAAFFKEELLKNPTITGVAAKNGGDNNNTVKVSGDQQVNISVETIDASYLTLLHIPVIAGRDFSVDYSGDAAQSALVNEAFVKEAGWKQPIGEQIKTFDGKTYVVAGVVKNYHYRPLTEKIGPQFFTMDAAGGYGMLYIKIKPGTETASLQGIARTFKRLFPMSPFIYAFKQQQNEQSYATEARWKQIILFSAILTIFISCTGLFGLSILAVEKRLKEIGVRKVLGASVSRIVSMLSVDFLKLILISLAVSVPIAWIAASRWLQHYPYRIALSWWLFLSGGLLVIGVAIITISFQSIKAAITNPVRSLRSE
ncbi:ABC transporter permease [Mucilaginibacter sp. SG564]|uniref:ABC transporter permease n=1 Tax=Mucilaginibacter sp. SG564 TaxID=2587022 RepID=UPI001552A744|nr:ABC transporter permease [Mucilaginibacter sp. SG564]NOW96122.1 putative ABC transport system permease protein [Mucilaginibacter sp. SG564]